MPNGGYFGRLVGSGYENGRSLETAGAAGLAVPGRCRPVRPLPNQSQNSVTEGDLSGEAEFCIRRAAAAGLSKHGFTQA
jgi:hypothetical protein